MVCLQVGTGSVIQKKNQMMSVMGLVEKGTEELGASTFSAPASNLAVMDLNGDAQPELVVGNLQTRTVQVYGALSTGTAIEAIEAALASLLESYPNPFREATRIRYDVEQAGPVTLTIYDILGRRICILIDAQQPAGTHHAAWDGTDESGHWVASGSYLYRLRVGGSVNSKQAIRLQ